MTYTYGCFDQTHHAHQFIGAASELTLREKLDDQTQSVWVLFQELVLSNGSDVLV